MKPFLHSLIRPRTILAALLGLALVSWSPTAPDAIVELGWGNFTNGSHQTATEKITAYRGFVSGYDNKIGVGDTWNYSAVVGFNNKANAQSSVIAGFANTVAVTATDGATSLSASGVFGSSNTVPNSRSHLLVSGYGNTANATTSVVTGAINTLEGPLTNGEPCQYSAAIGLNNHVMASSGWAMGEANVVSGNSGVAIGAGTNASKEKSTALGRYNAVMKPEDVLVIGSGVDFNNRSTALSVTSDGGVILGRAQGDISMGAYQ